MFFHRTSVPLEYLHIRDQSLQGIRHLDMLLPVSCHGNGHTYTHAQSFAWGGGEEGGKVSTQYLPPPKHYYWSKPKKTTLNE